MARLIGDELKDNEDYKNINVDLFFINSGFSTIGKVPKFYRRFLDNPLIYKRSPLKVSNIIEELENIK